MQKAICHRSVSKNILPDAGASTKHPNSPGLGPSGVLDPVLIKLFLVVLIFKYRAPPLRARPADLAYLIVPLSFPYLPSIGVKATLTPPKNRPRSPQANVIVATCFCANHP